MTHHLPPHVPTCCGSRFDIDVDADGTTAAYHCSICGELIADLILGAEP